MLFKSIFAVALLIASQTAHADFIEAKGSAEDFQKQLDTSEIPVAILYTAPWIKNEYKDFVTNIQKYVEPNYRGKMKFILVDVEKNPKLAEEILNADISQVPALQLFHPVRSSSTSKVLRAKEMDLFGPDKALGNVDKVPEIRSSVEIAIDPNPIKSKIVDFTNDPLIKLIRAERKKLKKDIAIFTKAQLENCLDIYTKSATDLLLQRFEVRDQIRDSLYDTREVLRNTQLSLRHMYIDLSKSFQKEFKANPKLHEQIFSNSYAENHRGAKALLNLPLSRYREDEIFPLANILSVLPPRLKGTTLALRMAKRETDKALSLDDVFSLAPLETIECKNLLQAELAKTAADYTQVTQDTLSLEEEFRGYKNAFTGHSASPIIGGEYVTGGNDIH